jgi:hypothetical protein
MFKRIITSTILLPTLFLLTGCPAKETKEENQQLIQVKMGNPYSLIKGTDTQPNISSQVFALSNEFQLTTIFTADSFINRKPKLKRKDHGPSSIGGVQFGHTDKTSQHMSYTVIRSENSIELRNGNNNASLFFTPSGNDSWALTHLKFGDDKKSDKYQITPIHTSISKDNNYVSFLVSYEEKARLSNYGLIAFYFHIGKLKTLTLEELQKAQGKYVYKNALASRWDSKKTLELQVCSQTEPQILKEVQTAVDQWSSALKNRLSIKLVKSRISRPFTDLNTRCISFIDGYLNNSKNDHQVLGYTIMNWDQNTNQLVDGDILMMKDEFLKSGVPMENDFHEHKRAFAFLHEIGHLLGLDHKFDGTNSIMSYNFNLTPQLYPYDIEAINQLYPIDGDIVDSIFNNTPLKR